MSSTALAGGRRNVKKGYELDQRRRVKDAMEKQKAARKERMDLARKLGGDSEAAPNSDALDGAAADGVVTDPMVAVGGDEMTDGAEASPSARGKGGKKGGAKAGEGLFAGDEVDYRGQLMMPEWMIAAPEGLSEQWLVCARPEGRRCLVIASGGRTVSRLRDGRILHAFNSAMPNGRSGGGSRGRVGGSDFSILDCVFCETSQCYWICDVMCWKGHSVYDCTSEFRLFWLNQKLAEDAQGVTNRDQASNEYPLVPVTWFTADQAGLEATYKTMGLHYTRDGLLFVHRQAHYELGLSALSLVWKDTECSRYLSEVYAGLDPSIQVACLRVDNDSLVTCDDPPVVVARGTQEQMAVVKTNKSGFALFKVCGIDISFADESGTGSPIVTVRKPSPLCPNSHLVP